jgi:hypothetical protein
MSPFRIVPPPVVLSPPASLKLSIELMSVSEIISPMPVKIMIIARQVESII